jgi:hypothetical protein
VGILVDPAVWPWRGRRWAHLISDTSLEELHAFAAELGLERAWLQGAHYDVPSEVRERALEAGAVPVSAAALVRALRAAGLRRRSRVHRLPGESSPGDTPVHPGGAEDG